MLSIVLPVRNTRRLAERCLASIGATLRLIGAPEDFEVILIDDDSDAQQRIPRLFLDFRKQCSSVATLIHLTTRRFYTYACSLGLSLAKGESILFLSHDMVLTPDYVRTLLNVLHTDSRVGIVRGVSPHVDSFPQHVVRPPAPCRSYEEVCAFAREVAALNGSMSVEDRFLIGDSFLISRRVIDAIGVMDMRYVHLFGDLDLGLRAQRAGFKLMCAKGAWLHHEGAGHTRDRAAAGVDANVMRQEALELVATNYARFRERWGLFLPIQYPGAASIDFERLCSQAPRPDEYAKPLAIDLQASKLL